MITRDNDNDNDNDSETSSLSLRDMQEGVQFVPEYLVEYRDSSFDPSWESASNISEDCLRDFEENWWKRWESDSDAEREWEWEW